MQTAFSTLDREQLVRICENFQRHVEAEQQTIADMARNKSELEQQLADAQQRIADLEAKLDAIYEEAAGDSL